MSFDGSFILESALERFLSRHPNLRSVPKLGALSQKGGALTADELVATIADPFTSPELHDSDRRILSPTRSEDCIEGCEQASFVMF
ncbi:uncharacterized protein A4U43_C05F17900 [Asparagus officinalis]|uniref:Uncharacterized protein n=1 Tax=Asparagus officinalis TaxID=4686 RepID=A0A5P1EUY3_ASPOF|nr:uncharacterized protein A4U43_C05F17900 [Asparagus officinalis]